MLICKMFLFAATYLLLSMAAGYLVGFEKNGNWKELLMGGMMALWCLFEILALIVTWTKGSLTFLTELLFGGILACCAVKGLVQIKQKGFSLPSRNRREGKLREDKRGMVLRIAFFLLVLFQVEAVCLFWHEDLDDATYVGISVVSYFTDTVNLYSPHTGEIMNVLGEEVEYVLSSYPVFWGMWAKLFQIHPAILLRTVLPAVLIPMHYLVFWMIGNEVFERRRSKYLFLFFVAFLNLFGGFSIRSTSSFLLYRIWQGKAALCNIVIPLFYYFYIVGRKRKRAGYWYRGVYLSVLAAGMSCFSGVLLMPILVAVCTVLEILYKKPWRKCLLLAGSSVSSVILGALYVVFKGI